MKGTSLREEQVVRPPPVSWHWMSLNNTRSKYIEKVKVTCTLVQALRFCTGSTAHRGSRGIAVLYRH